MGYAFISYSSKQQQDADALRHLLHTNGIDTWMAPYDIPDGSDYADVINQVIQDAACLVLLLTEDSQNSTFVDKEIERALHYGKTIAPIQLDAASLNDSFTFYLCNQQIVMVPAIDETSPKIQSLLRHLQYLCNDRLPAKAAAADAARDKRVRRQRTARLLKWLGAVLVAAALFCGNRYVMMTYHVTILELYQLKNVPTFSEVVSSFAIFFVMAAAGVAVFLYGAGLRDPKKKSWSPLRILPARLLLPGFAVLCGAAAAMLRWFSLSVMEIITSLAFYKEPVDSYLLPQWIPSAAWILFAAAAAGLVLSAILALIRDSRNGFAAWRSLRNRASVLVTRWKRGGQ